MSEEKVLEEIRDEIRGLREDWPPPRLSASVQPTSP